MMKKKKQKQIATLSLGLEVKPCYKCDLKAEVEQLRKENEKLTINMNAFGLAAKRLAEENKNIAKNIFAELRTITVMSNVYGEYAINCGKLDELKNKYLSRVDGTVSIGDTIKIISMHNEPQYAGRTGVVTHFDDAGELHGTWGGCALIPEVDTFEIMQ